MVMSSALCRPTSSRTTSTTPRSNDYCHVAPPWTSGLQFKFAGVYPLARRYTKPHAVFTTLLMSTGLTFGTITSLYGLQAGIFTSNISTALQATRLLEFGGVTVNEAPTFRADQMPYGGIKDSGNTKEGPAWAVREMTEERLVVIQL